MKRNPATDRQKYINAKHALEDAKRRLKRSAEKLDAVRLFIARLSMYSAGVATNDNPATLIISKHLDAEVAALKKVLQ